MLEDLARSAAATGNDAGATMIHTTGERKLRKRLRGNTVNIEEDEVGDVQELRRVIVRIREVYNKIREKLGDR